MIKRVIIMVTIRQLIIDVNALIRDLAQAMRPGLAWSAGPTRILRCPSRRGRRATVVFRLDLGHLAYPADHATMIAGARKWMKEHRIPVILDERCGHAQQLVGGNKVVAFNIKANRAKIRIKASTRCAAT